MKFPSEKYSMVNATTRPRWEGPCADSFCYASCTSAHCSYGYRLGTTPAEHNQKLTQMRAGELEAARKLVAASEPPDAP